MQTNSSLIEQGYAVFSALQEKLNLAIDSVEAGYDLSQFELCVSRFNDWYRAFRKSARISSELEVKILELNDRMFELSRIKKNQAKLSQGFFAKFLGSLASNHHSSAHLELVDLLTRIKLLTIKISDDLKKQ